MPARRPAPPPAPAPKRRPPAARPVAARESTRNVTITRGKRAAAPREPLKARRRRARTGLAVAGVALACALLGLALYGLWHPSLRIATVTASGPNAEAAAELARAALEGRHGFVLPRDSLFLVPEEEMRARVLSAYPDLEAVSITARGTTALHLTTVPRAEAFLWCGEAYDPAAACWRANAEGLVFAPAAGVASTSPLRAYGPLEGGDPLAPVGNRMGYASGIPDAIRFVKALRGLGADVESFAFRGDEAEVRTEAGTRVVYVIGKEAEAAVTAASVFPQLALNDGSIAYVDLRFPGKAYFKRAGEPAEAGE